MARAGAGAAREGGAAGILAAERTALNLLGRLSGVATMTARYVRAIEGTGARILDTRKTTPGLRALEKQAVVAGGGQRHRAGLFDAMLVKENHSALGGGVGEATRRALAAAADGVPVEIECSTQDEVDQALAAGATSLLLDNMAPDELRRRSRASEGARAPRPREESTSTRCARSPRPASTTSASARSRIRLRRST